MCVLAFRWRDDARWPFLLIGNRDERHARPTAAMARWDGESIVAGRDLLTGGTWLGVSKRGAAVVTNFSIGRIATGPSRGGLVPDFLRGRASEGLAEMNPFNLLTFGADGARFLSNYPGSILQPVTGSHALANAGLDERVFRAEQVRTALARWAGNPDTMLDAFGDDAAPGGQIPVFIRNPVYGTRCSTVVAVDAQGHGTIVERSFDGDGARTGQVQFGFDWPFLRG